MDSIILILAAVTFVTAVWLWRAREVTIIYPPNVGLRYRDGRFERELPPGRYVRVDPFKRAKIVNLSLAELPNQLGEITVLSQDQFSFRLALAPVLKITDARLYIESQSVSEQYSLSHFIASAGGHTALHWLVAAAAVEVVASRTLEQILADQALVGDAIQAKLADAIAGASVERILLTGINLPPETRKMFTDVERAKMEAQAGLERARGEQAALRVLANAARLVTDNPALGNLRLLQAIEASKSATTIVIGDASALPGLGGHARTKPVSRTKQ